MTAARKHQPNYFAQYRPRADTLKAKTARAQLAAAERPISLPRVLFLELSGDELVAAIAAEKRGRP